ncbi:hypothetical protein [Microbacterium kunmingense]|uniref:hypothetical protein n=1 Tax=Microbacterium kunmingense TaxID=2915939 RepID=UPI00200612C8|nr:hypothetical protein [Microbacterium kunmingense]
MFNGTLIVGGLLVTAFSVYIAHDLAAVAGAGGLDAGARWRAVPTLFVVMGIMLAGVGAVPVSLSLLVHNLCAMGLAAMFLALVFALIFGWIAVFIRFLTADRPVEADDALA